MFNLVSPSPTMYSMLEAGGLTDVRALLCSVTHSSMNARSLICGSLTEEVAATSRRVQVHHTVVATTRTMTEGRVSTTEKSRSCGFVTVTQEMTPWRRKQMPRCSSLSRAAIKLKQVKK